MPAVRGERVSIRACESRQDLETCVRIQHEVWGKAARETLGASELLAACRKGGILLGAWINDAPAGFVFSYRVTTVGGNLQHSHLLAIHPAFRGRGIAFALKRAQYEAALRQGDHWLIWTFDPLEAVNAHLNLARLGVRCRRYFVDFYGITGSPLHAGLDTDRLLAEWEVREGGGVPVPVRPPSPPPSAVTIQSNREGLPRPGVIELNLGKPFVTIPIPAQIQGLKRADPELAKTWQQATRSAFQAYLRCGYYVCDFVLQRSSRAGNLPAFLLRAEAPSNPLVDGLDFSSVPFRG